MADDDDFWDRDREQPLIPIQMPQLEYEPDQLTLGQGILVVIMAIILLVVILAMFFGKIL